MSHELLKICQKNGLKIYEFRTHQQPPGLESFNFPNHVFKLKKAFYGLKQAPRVWYERQRKFLTSIGSKMGKIDTTLFIKPEDNDMLIVQIYVSLKQNLGL